MKIISPLVVFLPRKTMPAKKIYINLNGYRNWHPKVSNDIKIKYLEAIKDQLEGVKLLWPIELELTFFKSQNRVTDRANVLSVTEKFFCDALVTCGCLPDDNDRFIASTHYYSGGIDRENPRVEIVIHEASENVV